MTRPTLDELEMELRVLGRQLGEETPGQALLERTVSNSATHMSICAQGIHRRRQLRLLLGMGALVAGTLPIPLLFLWGDWAAASALFGKVLSPTASEIASSVYLWIKFCALSLTYIILLTMLSWWSLMQRMSTPGLPEMKRL